MQVVTNSIPVAVSIDLSASQTLVIVVAHGRRICLAAPEQRDIDVGI